VIVGFNAYDQIAALGWFGSATGLTPPDVLDWDISPATAGEHLGRSLASAGDVNGDGMSDVIVGAPDLSNGEANEGSIHLYHGSTNLIDVDPYTSGVSPAGSGLGFAVAGAGDVNADGYSDVAIAAPYYDNGLGAEGRVFVLHGSATGASWPASWEVRGNTYKQQLGASIAGAGDVNGDGYDDLLVGAPNFSPDGITSPGAVYLWYGGPIGLYGGTPTTPASANWSAQGNQDLEKFAASIASAGDVNGDGFSDVLVGAPDFSNGETKEGAVYVWLGSAGGLGANGLPSNADWSAESNFLSAVFGTSVSTAGDVNADGYSDIIIGAPVYRTEGTTFAWLGSASGLGANGTPANADWSKEGTDSGQRYGQSVGTAGDVNGDGFSDVVIGAPNTGAQDTGEAYVHLGNASGIDASPFYTVISGVGSPANSHLGQFVGPAGDIEGDGYSEFFVATPGAGVGGKVSLYDRHQFTTINISAGIPGGAAMGPAAGTGDVNGDGFADVFIGMPGLDSGAGGFVPVYGAGGLEDRKPLLRQWKVLSNGRISHLGNSDHDRAFRIAHLTFSPFGRQRVQPEYEVKPVGQVLNGTGILKPLGYVDLTKFSPTTSQVGDVQLLTPNTAYHWRMRYHYDTSQSPWQPFSRWLTIPIDGANETDLRTSSVALVSVGPTPRLGVQLETGTPNPFLESTTIRFSLPADMSVRVGVYDVRGRLVRDLVRGSTLSAGPHVVEWDGRGTNGVALSSGAYFVRIATPSGELTRPIVLER
jgi:hypothetical protein